jgi:alpha-galactosidase
VAHPDWCLHVPGRPRQLGRNQMVLDFSRQEVRDHIYNALAAILSRYDSCVARPWESGCGTCVLTVPSNELRLPVAGFFRRSANVEYVKWDMNRPLTEVYSAAAEMGEVWQAEISHRYMLGVYELQQRLTTQFPHVLLENCASGGTSHDILRSSDGLY